MWLRANAMPLPTGAGTCGGAVSADEAGFRAYIILLGNAGILTGAYEDGDRSCDELVMLDATILSS